MQSTAPTDSVLVLPFVHATLFPGQAWCLPATDDSQWRGVSVPHDFVVEGTFDKGADKSHGWVQSGCTADVVYLLLNRRLD